MIQESELDNSSLNTMIGKAMTDVNSGLQEMYEVPFNDVAIHPKGIPEKVRWLTAEIAKCIAMEALYDDGEPNETNVTSGCFRRTAAQIQALIDCEAGLTYLDNTPVPRIGDCPDDSPGGGQGYVPVMSNTINDDAVFSLDDIVDEETDSCPARGGTRTE